MKKSLIVLATTAALASSLVSTSSIARGFPGQRGERPANIQEGQDNQSERSQSEQRRGSHNPEQRLLRLTRILNLSDEQVSAIETIQDNQKEPMDDLKESMKVARESLRVLIQADTYDEKAVTTIAADIGELVAQLTLLKSASKFKIYQVLTDEQRVQLEELLNAFGGRQGRPTEG